MALNTISYKAGKSVVMICRTKEDKHLNFPVLNCLIRFLLCVNVKYLGHFITKHMTNNEDIERQRRMMYYAG